MAGKPTVLPAVLVLGALALCATFLSSAFVPTAKESSLAEVSLALRGAPLRADGSKTAMAALKRRPREPTQWDKEYGMPPEAEPEFETNDNVFNVFAGVFAVVVFGFVGFTLASRNFVFDALDDTIDVS
eukprot:TRINITY_DN674_c0_g3_i1.p2 TRINITY_DN674_c0_g3~~TRINITY_DN674_c0_g3_i1.p2  ORF type:complete len:129 (+),score=33.82 TRINITY_DN674_c0_g3_i1:97-483(+)